MEGRPNLHITTHPTSLKRVWQPKNVYTKNNLILSNLVYEQLHLHHSTLPTPRYTTHTTVHYPHHSTLPTPQYTTNTTVNYLHHSTLPTPQYTTHTTVHYLHHNTLPTPQYTTYTTVHYLHHSTLTTLWYWQPRHSICQVESDYLFFFLCSSLCVLYTSKTREWSGQFQLSFCAQATSYQRKVWAVQQLQDRWNCQKCSQTSARNFLTSKQILVQNFTYFLGRVRSLA